MATTSNFGLLLVGRFILGFAVALSAIAECIYIAEISTPEKRGLGQFTFLFTWKDH
jgi:SP family facilitated glucose transporter-like MFS transporter 12